MATALVKLIECKRMLSVLIVFLYAYDVITRVLEIHACLGDFVYSGLAHIL